MGEVETSYVRAIVWGRKAFREMSKTQEK